MLQGLVVRTSGASSSSPGTSSGIAGRSEPVPMVVSLVSAVRNCIIYQGRKELQIELHNCCYY